MFVESFKSFDPPITKWRFFKFFAKLNGNHILLANFSKFYKYQTFGLIELHDVRKGKLADRICKLWKSCVYDYRVVEHTTFEILTFWFWFANFQTNFVKDFMKKFPGFKIDFESIDKVLPLHQYLWSEISRQWKSSPLIFFLKFARMSVLLLKFCQIREMLKPQFCWYF